MVSIIFSHLARVFLLFLVAVHAVLLFFLLQGNTKAEVRYAIFAALSLRDPATFALAQAPAIKKPKIPLLISSLALPGKAVFYSGQTVRLESNKPVSWVVDQISLGSGRNALWAATSGRHVIQARHETDVQHMVIYVQ